MEKVVFGKFGLITVLHSINDMNNQRLENNLPDDQKALIVMDVFTGQTTSPVVESYKENNICIVKVPANMTKYYQPLDLTING